jgi:hypothetical protein
VQRFTALLAVMKNRLIIIDTASFYARKALQIKGAVFHMP